MASETITQADHLDMWLFNLELECSGASLCPLEEVAIGGAVLKMADLLPVLRQASADRAAVAELVEALEEAKRGFDAVQVLITAMADGRPSLMVETFIERADAVLSRHQAGLGKGGVIVGARDFPHWPRMLKRSTACRKDTVVAPSLEKADAILAALSSPSEGESAPASSGAGVSVLLPRVMTAAMINAWSNGLTVSSDENAARTTFQEAWQRVIAAAPLSHDAEGESATVSREGELREAAQRAYDAVLKDAPNWFEDGSAEQKAVQIEAEHLRKALSSSTERGR